MLPTSYTNLSDAPSKAWNGNRGSPPPQSKHPFVLFQGSGPLPNSLHSTSSFRSVYAPGTEHEQHLHSYSIMTSFASSRSSLWLAIVAWYAIFAVQKTPSYTDAEALAFTYPCGWRPHYSRSQPDRLDIEVRMVDHLETPPTTFYAHSQNTIDMINGINSRFLRISEVSDIRDVLPIQVMELGVVTTWDVDFMVILSPTSDTIPQLPVPPPFRSNAPS